jgi:hypothetical protein
MRTPAGSECPYYFEDFFRGRDRQECRLIDQNPNSKKWTPDLCAKCRVPTITLANACPNMILEATVRSGFLGIGRTVEVKASCIRSMETVKEPEIGCGLCHEEISAFIPPESES